jgi:hypothetical protein
MEAHRYTSVLPLRTKFMASISSLEADNRSAGKEMNIEEWGYNWMTEKVT